MKLIKSGIKTSISFMRFCIDGIETVVDWCFVTKYLVAVADALRTATGSDNGYMAYPGVNTTAL